MLVLVKPAMAQRTRRPGRYTSFTPRKALAYSVGLHKVAYGCVADRVRCELIDATSAFCGAGKLVVVGHGLLCLPIRWRFAEKP